MKRIWMTIIQAAAVWAVLALILYTYGKEQAATRSFSLPGMLHIPDTCSISEAGI